VASLALWFGYWQFRETQTLAQKTLTLQLDALEHDREAKAVDLFLKFNEVQHSIAVRRPKLKGEALFWQQNMALTITESVFKLMEDDEGWKATVKFMLREQTDFLKDPGMQCDTYLPAFVAFAKEVVGHDVCK